MVRINGTNSLKTINHTPPNGCILLHCALVLRQSVFLFVYIWVAFLCGIVTHTLTEVNVKTFTLYQPIAPLTAVHILHFVYLC